MKRSLLPFWVLAFTAIVMSLAVDAPAQAESQASDKPRATQGAQLNSAKSQKSSALKTQKDQINYAVGVNFIGTIKKQGIDIDLEMLMRGMKDAFAGKDLQMTDGEIRKAIMMYQGEVRRMQAKASAEAAENKRREGEAFLAENKKKEGIVTLPSGLQYRILQEGQGRKPTESDMVEFRHRGTLIDGAEYDGSYRTGHSVNHKVADLIPGWREALQLMTVGSKWQLFIPPRLAYGSRGVQGTIGPNETLIVELELLSIK